MRRLYVVLLPLLAAVGAAPAPAAAAVCSDYPNQAAAQATADTRDADGIYCESLPYPCTSGTSTAPSRSAPAAAPRTKWHVSAPRLGAPVLLPPQTKRTGCLVDGPLPDAACTPGAYYPLATKTKVCKPGYSKLVRNVSRATKQAIYDQYDITASYDGHDGEADHLVSLELGGSNSRANLFPEAATPVPGAHEKDRLENELHSEVCDGTMTLRHAQQLIAGNWVTAYNNRF